ncbi:2-polyprenyl-6-methoxyphenol hydroxylase-like FAD-dependent oxidoreductase [Actinoplanes octamycinicus]|uniref:2-polyprenyl-6-methoxyphenol hydroxylase-like FAD-dependent oxidoreductase n=1 Tax=Actinoplanes octamycinicus TaxID=135948 RepID=A0A7W7GRW1_9ACTN|nr:NAD(P)/FAD-dependent oxidoreductase [Actinoplanes octamycinicus]MBB4737142.1 2-polyprenyl-6-methoxyphenol hydroxylase-like FAD-dependent oxidoreductase [Actinoplanes octamycinicus]GIE62039.1 FAD-dependent oxidoreductase [Actinoplanes octamycinicus]
MTNTAAVIGGGIAGTAAAIALRHAGFDPVIHERHERSVADERGAFLTVAVNGLAALRSLGLSPEKVLAKGFPTPAMALRGASGRVLAEMSLGREASGPGTLTIRRSDLYAAMRDEAEARGIPVVYGAALTRAVSGPDGAGAEFADGRRVRADLLVGADGLRSRTRRSLDPGAPAPHYLGLLNAGGFTAGPVEPRLAPPPGVMQMAFGRRAFFGWATAPDGSVWWFANPPSKRPVEPGAFTAETWKAHLIELFEGDPSSPAAELIRLSDEVVGPWNTEDMGPVRVWHDDRIVLVGDAAHAMAPTSGQGASQALEDAVVLGHSLRGRVPIGAGLTAYEKARRPRVEKVAAHGRRGNSSKVQGPVGAAIRDAMMPLVFRLLQRKGDPQAWIFEHRLPPLPAGT